MQNKRHLFVMAIAVIALVLSACAAPAAAPGGEAGEMDSGDSMAMGPVTLDWNLGTEPPSLDPSLATDTSSIAILNETYLGLTELDPDTQEAGPELATSWEISEDGTVWTFTMRDDVSWVMYSDGEIVEATDDDGNARIVNANDVVYGVQRTCNAETASDYAYVLYIIAGCEAANLGEGSADDVGVVALDDFTVEFTLNSPAAYFGQIASMWVARPMPAWVIEEVGDGWTEPGIFQSNGAYVVSEWIHNESIQLTKNPMWYGWDELDVAGNIEVINMTMIEEASTAFAMYENNEIDLAALPLEQMDLALSGEYGAEYHNTPRNCTYYYGFTTEKEAVSDVRVRRALSMAMDRKTMVEDVLKGGEQPANAFTNPSNYGSPGGNAEVAPWALPEEAGGTGYDAALEMARGLMAEAGYEDGAGLSLTLGHNTSEAHAKIAQAVQAMWQEAFPELEVVIESQEWGVYLASLDKDAPLEGKPDVWRLGWCQDYPHANNWIHEVFNTRQGNNEVLLSEEDEQIGELVAQFNDATIAAQTADGDAQLDLYKQAESLFVDDIAGIIPIYYYARNVVVKPWVDRLYSDDLYLYRWSVDAEAKSAGQ